MHIKTVIHPDCKAYAPFVASVLDGRAGEGRIIYQSRNRNTISVHVFQGMELNVKRYKVPVFPNRIVYSFFRKTKARRAYEYALALLSRGIETARPVAYAETRHAGLVGVSYLISFQCPYTRNMYEFGEGTAEGREDILRAFGRFTARMHQAGFCHADYSPGNILFDKVDGAWRFCVVDINRMRFGRLSLESGCRNFERLWGTREMFALMAEGYAEEMHFDRDTCVARVLHYRDKFWTRRNRTHPREARPL
ncbi:MAG: tyrosine protein kinase [Bacteroidales bacterium]|nr:tyrosine protein kinase [Bacteroidales bacterium]